MNAFVEGHVVWCSFQRLGMTVAIILRAAIVDMDVTDLDIITSLKVSRPV